MKFYGQFDPPVDQFIFERYFPDTGMRGVFVEFLRNLRGRVSK